MELRDDHGPEDLRQRTLVRVLGRLLRLRGMFVPVLLAFDLWIALFDTALWRQILMLGLACVMFALIIHDGILSHRLRTERVDALPGLIPNLCLIGLMQHVVVFATGGMASPAIPATLVAAILTGLVAEPRFAWTMIACVHLPAVWISTGIQLSGVLELTPTVLAWSDGSGAQTPTTTIAVALVMSLALIIITVFATLTAESLNQMVSEALRARDSALAARSQQAQELTTLSGEIAHELKNPLASVKGLAQLVSRELERGEPEGKSAERMQVLRREVDRMQTILEEFLNFSRPLVPLSRREVELRELVEHVIDLHEGVADEARVTLVARGQGRVTCDPRKVEQILINLVQNALDVAPRGTAVSLEIRARATTVEVEVRDEGPGIEASVRARVFEPGVTGKPEGSGLGLTIARALARQHDGELELEDVRNVDAGNVDVGSVGAGRTGTIARLRLPLEAPLEAPIQALEPTHDPQAEPEAIA